MDSGIYQIKNLLNGKVYIGSAVNLRSRWSGHRSRLGKGRHHSRHLQSSWDKNGPEAFEFSVLEYCEAGVLLEREQLFLDSRRPEFNICPTAGNSLGRRHSAETKQKISARKAGLKLPPRSDKYRETLSASLRGIPKPAHVMAALQEGRRNAVYTDEKREKTSNSLKKAYESGLRTRIKTQDHKNKISRAFSKLTEHQVREIRAKSAAGLTGRALAQEFSTPTSTISQIINGTRYRWVA